MALAAILGASGFSGQETLDRVLAHPQLDLLCLGSDSLAGRSATSLDPRLARDGAASLPTFVSNAEAATSGADVVFACLPHEEAAALVPPEDGIVVDLSGAHRLPGADDYDRWYGFRHPRPAELDDWCYAIPELVPPSGPLIANPGCYAVATVLALAPVADALDPESVVVDAKSGVSGAGRAPKASSHAAAVLDNVSPYRVGNHQHAPEIERVLGFPVCFVPHLLPLRRGLLVTCYARTTEDGLRERLEAAYSDTATVAVLPDGVVPDVLRVQGTDVAEIGVFEDGATGRAIIICAIDNLGKGAAGSAIQNANLALGYPQTAGLRVTGLLV
ncbi:MAG: N-acetyl-gamma-glutamyl-phosphate reductase [Actinomycetota bacterium]|nr:N-acetyl-gamma-glutamyl-phosphate reductase [Actinomycetota bacterium]